MANRVEDRLIPALYEEFLHERFVLLSTIDFETGGPNVGAISWVHAKSEQAIVFAVDYRSRVIQNIKKQPAVTLTVIANETTYSVTGDAAVTGASSSEVPIGLAIIELTIREVRDVMFYGSKIITEPQFEKTYDPEAARSLDEKVMNELKKQQ